MKKQILAVLSACMLGTALTAAGCGAGSSSSAADMKSTYSGGSYASDDMAVSPEENSADTSEAADAEFDAASETGSGADTETAAAQKQNEKLIYTYRYSVETKEFDTFSRQIAEKTEQLGGYVETSETNGSADSSNRSASMTLRIPADKIPQMLSTVNENSNVIYQNSSIENVTLQYVDMQSHIKALRTEQETLLKLIEKAEKLEDIITLQSQLTQVRYEIESYESQLRIFDNRIDYSTLYLDISEVMRTTTQTSSKTGFWEETKEKFSDNLYAVGQSLRASAVWLISSMPLLLPLILLALIFFIILRRWRRHRNAHAPSDRRQAPGGYQSIYKKHQKTQPEPDTGTQAAENASGENPADPAQIQNTSDEIQNASKELQNASDEMQNASGEIQDISGRTQDTEK